jgi:hypothetical protein
MQRDDEWRPGIAMAAWIRRSAKTSQTLTIRSVIDIMRFVVALCVFLRFRCDDLVTKDDDMADPMMVSYQSDGWSTFVSGRSVGLVGNVRVLRHGRAKKEFLLERTILKKIDSLGNVTARLFLSPPRPLDTGLACWNMVQAACEHQQTLRYQDFTGCTASVYVQDGMHADGFFRHMQARHMFWYERDVFPGDQDDIWMQSKTESVWGVKCRAHVGSNAIKWGNARHSTETYLEDIHCAMRSLRQTAMAIHEHIKPFVIKTLVFDADENVDWDFREGVWQSLGVDVENMNLFRKINPWWNPETSQLFVNASLALDPAGVDSVCGLLLFASSWDNFSDTRLGGVGTCCRKWLLSMCLGLTQLFKDTWDDRTTSRYYAGGYNRLGNVQRLWLCIGAVAWLPVESMVLDLLEDDRFLRRFDAVLEDMKAECHYVAALPTKFFDHIVNVVGLDMIGADLHSEALLSMHIGFGYCHMESFWEIGQFPWKLTQGNIEQNVSDLHDRPFEPTEKIASDMWFALRAGLPYSLFVRTLKLVRDSAQTTLLTEKGHGQGRRIVKPHNLICTDSMCCRATLGESRALVARCRDDVAAEELRMQIDECTQKRRRKTPTQMYCGKLMADNGRMQENKKELVSDARRIMASHHVGYKALSVAEKKEYVEKAKFETEMRKLVNEDKVIEFRSRLRVIESRKRASTEADDGVPNTLSELRFSDAELEALAREAFKEEHAGDGFRARWASLVSSPSATDPALVRSLEAIEQRIAAAFPKPAPPWWLKEICPRRDHFSGCAFYFKENYEKIYYLLLAKQSPFKAVFLEGIFVPPVVPAFEGLSPNELAAVDMDPMLLTFDISQLTYKLAQEIEFDPEGQVFVLSHLKFVGETLQTCMDPVLLEDKILCLPAQRHEQASREPRGRPPLPPDLRALLLEEFPWLTSDDFAQESNPVGGGGGDGGAGGGAAPRAPMRLDPKTDEDRAAEVRARLLAVREEWELDWTDMWFYVRLLGGGWTDEFKKTAADAACMFAREGAKSWCLKFRFPKQKALYFSVYGIETSNMVTREWARRGEFYFLMWYEEDMPAIFVYSDAMIESYVPTLEWCEWATRQDVDSDEWALIEQVQNAAPTNT